MDSLTPAFTDSQPLPPVEASPVLHPMLPPGAHPNARLIRDGFRAFAEGDVTGLEKLIAVDSIMHMPGHHPLSGDYKGREAILELFTQVAVLTDASFRLELVHVFADDHVGAAIHTIRAERDARSLAGTYCLLFQIIDGRAMDLELMPLHGDSTDEDAFWN